MVALGLAVPYALGDEVALWAVLLRPLGFAGAARLLLVWLVLTVSVVGAASFGLGYVLPLWSDYLRGQSLQNNRAVSTVSGARAEGQLIGLWCGFGLLVPWLGTVGSWRAAVYILVALGTTIAIHTIF